MTAACSRSNAISVTLALGSLAAAPKAWCYDAIDLASTYSQLRNRLHGYRIEYLSFQYLGEKCTLPIFEHVNAPTGDRILLLHGIGGSGMSVERLATHAANLGLPAKNFLMVEWPRHGSSRCDQVNTLQQAADALVIGLNQLGARPGGRNIKTIVATSLGVAVSTMLYDKFPKARYVWISPPVLEPAALNDLMTGLTALNSLEDTRGFLSRGIADETFQVPDFIVYDILARLKRAQPLLRGIDREGLRAKLLSIPAEQVTVFEGSKDRLVPRTQLDPIFTHKYATVTTVLEGCGHDMVFDCETQIIETVRDQLN